MNPRIEAIKKYFQENSGKFDIEALRQSLLQAGYTQEEIAAAINYNNPPVPVAPNLGVTLGSGSSTNPGTNDNLSTGYPLGTPEATPVSSQSSQAANLPGKGFDFSVVQMFVMRWLPFFFMFDAFASALLVLTLFLPMVIFSLGTVWATGILYIVWVVFFFGTLIAQMVLSFMAFRATYNRKPNAKKLAIIAIIVSLVYIALGFITGDTGLNPTTLAEIFWPIVTLISINKYVNYFDVGVSGPKGLNLGPTQPSKAEKGIIYTLYGLLAGFMVVTMLIVGLIMTVVGGATAGMGLITAPFQADGNATLSDQLSNNLSNSTNSSDKFSCDVADTEASSIDDLKKCLVIRSSFAEKPMLVDFLAINAPAHDGLVGFDGDKNDGLYARYADSYTETRDVSYCGEYGNSCGSVAEVINSAIEGERKDSYGSIYTKLKKFVEFGGYDNPQYDDEVYKYTDNVSAIRYTAKYDLSDGRGGVSEYYHIVYADNKDGKYYRFGMDIEFEHLGGDFYDSQSKDIKKLVEEISRSINRR